VSEWKETTIGEVSVVFDGPHATPAKVSGGPVFLGIPCLSRGRLDLTKAEHLSEHDFKRWTRRVEPAAGDVVFSYETRLGEAALIPPGLRCCLGRRMALIRPASAKIDSRFLLYYYLSSEFQDLIRSRTVSGSTVDRILLEEFPKFPIRVPDLATQKEIASLLSALDDKIELNRRMNQTLESMARAIFRSWFVDFDPVVAKAAGRQPFGMSADVAAAFPAAFWESSFGRLPTGWQSGSMLKHARLLSGGTPKTSIPEYWGGQIAWASAADVSQCGECFLLRSERTITARGLAESATQLIDAFATVVVARGATTGRMCMLGSSMAINQTCYALRSNSDCHFYVFCLAKEVIGDLVHVAHGSVFDTITTQTFESSCVVLPDRQVVSCFNQAAEPLFRRILACQRESRTLAALRDALLPKLMSGELRVRDAEKLVGRHV
jgi:type I restriction enzyme S subunit